MARNRQRVEWERDGDWAVASDASRLIFYRHIWIWFARFSLWVALSYKHFSCYFLLNPVELTSKYKITASSLLNSTVIFVQRVRNLLFFLDVSSISYDNFVSSRLEHSQHSSLAPLIYPFHLTTFKHGALPSAIFKINRVSASER